MPCSRLIALLLISFTPEILPAAEPPLDRQFNDVVHPFLKEYCLGCHGTKKQEAKLDLSSFTSLAAVVKNSGIWETIRERLEAEEMPPAKAQRHPMPRERKAVLEWIN